MVSISTTVVFGLVIVAGKMFVCMNTQASLLWTLYLLIGIEEQPLKRIFLSNSAEQK